MTKKKTVVLPVVLIALVLTAGLVWFMNRPQATDGAKSITVEVIHGDDTTKSFPIRTDAETLRLACEEQKGGSDNEAL